MKINNFKALLTLGYIEIIRVKFFIIIFLIIGISACSTSGSHLKHLAKVDSTVETEQSQPQSGTITAADYDDQLNHTLFLEYATKFQQHNKVGSLNLPFIDLNKRIAIRVSDSNGSPVNQARIEIKWDDESKINLTTPATGIVYLYPKYDNLPNSFEIITIYNYPELRKKTVVSLDNLNDIRTVNIELDSRINQPKSLDIALVIDTTGSMGDELNYLKAELISIVNRINRFNQLFELRVSLIVYRDDSDQYVTRVFPFTNAKSLIKDLNKQTFDGGGDYPEAMDIALDAALELNWRQRSNKIILLVADAPPHNDRIQKTWGSVVEARAKQIHIVPVAASGVGLMAEYLMRSMAAITHSRYLFITDDSGVGNPHAEPSVDCYIVTRLDNLITRVIHSLISGQRQEPSPKEIIRTKGNYNNGICEIHEELTRLYRTHMS